MPVSSATKHHIFRLTRVNRILLALLGFALCLFFARRAGSDEPSLEMDQARPRLHPSARLLVIEFFPGSKRTDLVVSGRRWTLLAPEKEFHFFIEPKDLETSAK